MLLNIVFIEALRRSCSANLVYLWVSFVGGVCVRKTGLIGP